MFRVSVAVTVTTSKTVPAAACRADPAAAGLKSSGRRRRPLSPVEGPEVTSVRESESSSYHTNRELTTSVDPLPQFIVTASRAHRLGDRADRACLVSPSRDMLISRRAVKLVSGYDSCLRSLQKAEVRRSFISTTIREQRPKSHHKGATGRVRTEYPVLCHCQLGQDCLRGSRPAIRALAANFNLDGGTQDVCAR